MKLSGNVSNSHFNHDVSTSVCLIISRFSSLHHAWSHFIDFREYTSIVYRRYFKLTAIGGGGPGVCPRPIQHTLSICRYNEFMNLVLKIGHHCNDIDFYIVSIESSRHKPQRKCRYSSMPSIRCKFYCNVGTQLIFHL